MRTHTLSTRALPSPDRWCCFANWAVPVPERRPGEWSFNCDPTLTDSQVLEFLRTGVLILPAAVPDDVNRLSIDYLEGTLPASPMHIPRGMTNLDLERIRRSYAPATIMLERWFMEGVVLQPVLAGGPPNRRRSPSAPAARRAPRGRCVPPW